MKKWFVLLSLLLVMSFVMAVDVPDAGIGGEDVEKLQGMIEDYSPLSESGEVDYDKYKPFVTKAEVRIAVINSWLEENASWLKVVFGMVPSVTWLFFINVYILLVGLTYIVLRGLPFSFFDVLNKKIDLGLFEWSWANIVGLGVFVVADFFKVFAGISKGIYIGLVFLWEYALPYSVGAAVVVMILIGFGFVFFPMLGLRIITSIAKGMEERKKKRAAEKEAVDREALGKIVDNALS